MKLCGRFERKKKRADRPAQSAPTEPARWRAKNDAAPAPSPAARNLALAHHIERLIERGVIVDYTQAARMLSVSQPRMTHVMSLLLLAPAIQEAILLCEIAPKDKALRALARVAEWEVQVEPARTSDS